VKSCEKVEGGRGVDSRRKVKDAGGGTQRRAHLCGFLCVQDCHHHNHWQMALSFTHATHFHHPLFRERERQSGPTFPRPTRNFRHKYCVYSYDTLAQEMQGMPMFLVVLYIRHKNKEFYIILVSS